MNLGKKSIDKIYGVYLVEKKIMSTTFKKDV